MAGGIFAQMCAKHDEARLAREAEALAAGEGANSSQRLCFDSGPCPYHAKPGPTQREPRVAEQWALWLAERGQWVAVEGTAVEQVGPFVAVTVEAGLMVYANKPHAEGAAAMFQALKGTPCLAVRVDPLLRR